jgi:hypothetical protein
MNEFLLLRSKVLTCSLGWTDIEEMPAFSLESEDSFEELKDLNKLSTKIRTRKNRTYTKTIYTISVHRDHCMFLQFFSICVSKKISKICIFLNIWIATGCMIMILFSINVFTNALQSEFKNSVTTPIKIFLGVVTDFCRAFVKSLMENKII